MSTQNRRYFRGLAAKLSSPPGSSIGQKSSARGRPPLCDSDVLTPIDPDESKLQVSKIVWTRPLGAPKDHRLSFKTTTTRQDLTRPGPRARRIFKTQAVAGYPIRNPWLGGQKSQGPKGIQGPKYPGTQSQGPKDPGTQGPRDPGTQGPRDPGTQGPRDPRTQ